MQRILKKVSGLLHDRKKRTAGLIILTLIALCVAVFGGLALLSDRQNNAYRVYLGDEYLCAVRDEEELSSACDSFLSELRCPAVSQKYGNDPCRLEEAYVSESELTSGTEAKALIVAHYADVIEYGCGIRIDGELFGAVSDQSVVETALSDLLSDTMLAFGGESAEICETVETQMGYYSRAIFIPDAELLSRFEGDSLPAPQVKSVGVTEESGENGEELLTMDVVNFGDNLYAYCGYSLPDEGTFTLYSFFATEFIPYDANEIKSPDGDSVEVNELRFSIMSNAGEYWDSGHTGTITLTEDGLLFEGFDHDGFLVPEDDDSRLFFKDEQVEGAFSYLKHEQDAGDKDLQGFWALGDSDPDLYLEFDGSDMYIYRKYPDQ